MVLTVFLLTYSFFLIMTFHHLKNKLISTLHFVWGMFFLHLKRMYICEKARPLVLHVVYTLCYANADSCSRAQITQFGDFQLESWKNSNLSSFKPFSTSFPEIITHQQEHLKQKKKYSEHNNSLQASDTDLALRMELRNKLILWKPCVLVNHRRLHRNVSFPNFNHLFFAICHDRKWVMLTKRIFWNLRDEVYLPSANTAFLARCFYLSVPRLRYQLIPTEGIRTSHTLKARSVFGVSCLIDMVQRCESVSQWQPRYSFWSSANTFRPPANYRI